MSKYVFIGSEATGCYSGAEACEGTIMEWDIYEKYEKNLSDAFVNRYFHELDGKHSEVEGEYVFEIFSSINELMKFIGKKDPDTSEYLLVEQLYDEVEDEELSQDDLDIILKSMRKVKKEVSDIKSKYEHVSFYLTKADTEKVKEFVDKLFDGNYIE